MPNINLNWRSADTVKILRLHFQCGTGLFPSFLITLEQIGFILDLPQGFLSSFIKQASFPKPLSGSCFSSSIQKVAAEPYLEVRSGDVFPVPGWPLRPLGAFQGHNIKHCEISHENPDLLHKRDQVWQPWVLLVLQRPWTSYFLLGRCPAFLLGSQEHGGGASQPNLED